MNENKDPRIFRDVKVFAGDKFLPPADVVYRNLTWELNVKSDLLSGVVRRHNEIGIIESWGPHFRVSFDMKIKSFVAAKWTNILSFKGNGAKESCCRPGDRAPAIFLENKEKYLVFSNPVNGNGKYSYKFRELELNQWFKIIIEQISINGKVRISDMH